MGRKKKEGKKKKQINEIECVVTSTMKCIIHDGTKGTVFHPDTHIDIQGRVCVVGEAEIENTPRPIFPRKKRLYLPILFSSPLLSPAGCRAIGSECNGRLGAG